MREALDIGELATTFPIPPPPYKGVMVAGGGGASLRVEPGALVPPLVPNVPPAFLKRKRRMLDYYVNLPRKTRKQGGNKED